MRYLYCSRSLNLFTSNNDNCIWSLEYYLLVAKTYDSITCYNHCIGRCRASRIMATNETAQVKWNVHLHVCEISTYDCRQFTTPNGIWNGWGKWIISGSQGFTANRVSLADIHSYPSPQIRLSCVMTSAVKSAYSLFRSYEIAAYSILRYQVGRPPFCPLRSTLC